MWGRIVIGNNVYVGTNAIILPNVHICDNVIIGAGTIVSKDILADGVYVGIPARRVKSFDQWREDVLLKAYDTFGMTDEERKNFFDLIFKD